MSDPSGRASDEAEPAGDGAGRSAGPAVDGRGYAARRGQDAAANEPVQGVESEPPSAAQVFGDRVDLARRFVYTLAQDGVLRGLIGPREPHRLWSRHVLNSGVVAELLPPGCTAVDIGSGAGLPGIPLAIARPDCRIILVEPLERRAVFLRDILELLQLTNSRVVRGRAEDVVDDCGGADVVTSRAVAPLATVAWWSAPLLRIGGQMLALKGSSAAAEAERDGAAARDAGLVDVAVIRVGAGLVEPETIVVRGRRIATPSRRKTRTGRSRLREI